MYLLRYMDALDRIEEARRGPQGLLDDEWFDAYASRPVALPPEEPALLAPPRARHPAGEAGSIFPWATPPFSPPGASPMPDVFGPARRDPFGASQQAKVPTAVDGVYARLLGTPPAMGLATSPMPAASQPTDHPDKASGAIQDFLLRDFRPYVPRPLPADHTDEPEILLLADGGDGDRTPQATERDDQLDYGYPWYEPNSSAVGTVVDSANGPPTPESLRSDPQVESRTLPEKPFRQLPNPSVDERDLERAERKHRAIVAMWRESGRHTSADHLERFLDGGGSTLVIDRDEARRFSPIREAEQKNDRRFERSFFIGGDRGNAEKLASLKDGATTKIKDDFKVDYGPFSSVGQALDSSTTDFATAFGRLGFKSEGEFKATRRGDVIEIEGIVRHGFGDRYDFNPGQPYASEPNLLERKGNAKSYDRTSSWQRRATGTIRIDNGRLYSPRFTWEDIDS